jgi:hypothetical protein
MAKNILPMKLEEKFEFYFLFLWQKIRRRNKTRKKIKNGEKYFAD